MTAKHLIALPVASMLLVGLLPTVGTATFGGEDGRITFSRINGDRQDIFSADADGGDVKALTDAGKNHQAIISDWSPDGARIAFDSNQVDVDGRKDDVQIYVMNADGSEETQLTRGPGFHGSPGWSPDGTSIAIDSDWGKRSLTGIWEIPVDDADGVTVDEARRVTATPKNADFDGEPQFSPDGQTIVFTRFRSERETAIHTIDVDGSGLRRITDWTLNASDPDFSPDGGRLTFDSGDSGRPGATGDIYVANSDGSGLERLTKSKPLRKNGPFKLANNPVFSPSGTRIMFTQFQGERNDLVAIDIDGSNRETVLSIKGFPNKVDWGVSPAG